MTRLVIISVAIALPLLSALAVVLAFRVADYLKPQGFR